KRRLISFTFTYLTRIEAPVPEFYAGIRHLKYRINPKKYKQPPAPMTFCGATYRNPDDVNESGYWISSDYGQVFAFGDARTWEANGPYHLEGAHWFPVVAMAAHPS